MRDAKQNGREPAMPFSGQHIEYTGLTKREQFAGLALQGLMVGQRGSQDPAVNATIAVRHADALLVELNDSKG